MSKIKYVSDLLLREEAVAAALELDVLRLLGELVVGVLLVEEDADEGDEADGGNSGDKDGSAHGEGVGLGGGGLLINIDEVIHGVGHLVELEGHELGGHLVLVGEESVVGKLGRGGDLVGERARGEGGLEGERHVLDEVLEGAVVGSVDTERLRDEAHGEGDEVGVGGEGTAVHEVVGRAKGGGHEAEVLRGPAVHDRGEGVDNHVSLVSTELGGRHTVEGNNTSGVDGGVEGVADLVVPAEVVGDALALGDVEVELLAEGSGGVAELPGLEAELVEDRVVEGGLLLIGHGEAELLLPLMLEGLVEGGAGDAEHVGTVAEAHAAVALPALAEAALVEDLGQRVVGNVPLGGDAHVADAPPAVAVLREHVDLDVHSAGAVVVVLGVVARLRLRVSSADVGLGVAVGGAVVVTLGEGGRASGVSGTRVAGGGLGVGGGSAVASGGVSAVARAIAALTSTVASTSTRAALALAITLTVASAGALALASTGALAVTLAITSTGVSVSVASAGVSVAVSSTRVTIAVAGTSTGVAKALASARSLRSRGGGGSRLGLRLALVASAAVALKVLLLVQVLVVGEAPLSTIAIPNHSRVEAAGVHVTLGRIVVAVSQLHSPHDLPPALGERVVGGSHSHIVVSLIYFIASIRKVGQLGLLAVHLKVVTLVVGLGDHEVSVLPPITEGVPELDVQVVAVSIASRSRRDGQER